MGKKGFTLVELLVCLSLVILLVGVILKTFKAELMFIGKIVQQNEHQQIENFVLGKIIKDLRSASQVLPSSNKKQLCLQVGADQIEYMIKDKKVRHLKNSYTQYLTDDQEIKELSFSYIAPGLVKIELDQLSAVISLRNKL
ncbi:MAG: type II secretion system protein [bacterium]